MRRKSATTFAVPPLESVRALVSKYDRPGPRYTSYPTTPVWSDEFDDADFSAALRAAAPDEVSLYVHVPFCERLCTYCACNRVITQDHGVGAPFLDDIEREADQLAHALGRSPPSVQLAIGGGTPTFLAASELERLCAIVDARFPPVPHAERSIEVDPRHTNREQLEVLAARGFNRVSLGVQDLSPVVQHAIHRIQPLEQTRETTQDARALGFRSVNFDLIYGLPFQTVESFDETLDSVIELLPERIALYSYAHVTWISKQQRGFEKKDLPSPERKLAIFTHAISRLDAAGYRYFGLDHFALPDDELSRAADAGQLRRNFMGYTTRASVDLIALGPSAITELHNAYAQSERDPGAWSERIRAGRLATIRGWSLSDDDQRRKWLIQALMCAGEIRADAYEGHFHEPLRARIPDLDARLRPLAEDGLLIGSDGEYEVTPLGRLYLRPIAMVFDAYLVGPDADRPVFSRTV